MNKRKWLAELSELRAVFKDCLPIGENTQEADEYFNRLQQIIDTNDFQTNPNPIGREEFEHDDPDVQYSYLSDAVFKERSSRREFRAIGQDLADQSHVHEGQVPQLGGPISADDAPLSQCEENRDLEYGEQDCDHSGW
jgi:hypothetical protein